MRIAIALISLFVLHSLPSLAQRTKVVFDIKKDTVHNGERYQNLVTVKLAPKDRIVRYEVYFHTVDVPVTENIAQIGFKGLFKGDLTNESNVLNKAEYPLKIKLKTLQVDTVINIKVAFFVKPDPALTYKLGDEHLKDAEVFPEVMPVLQDKTNRPFRTVLSSSLLKGQKGMLVFSFVIDKEGKASRIKMVKNTFKTLTIEKLVAFIKQTTWTPGQHQGKVVRTVYGVHIVK